MTAEELARVDPCDSKRPLASASGCHKTAVMDGLTDKDR